MCCFAEFLTILRLKVIIIEILFSYQSFIYSSFYMLPTHHFDDDYIAKLEGEENGITVTL